MEIKQGRILADFFLKVACHTHKNKEYLDDTLININSQTQVYSIYYKEFNYYCSPVTNIGSFKTQTKKANLNGQI